MVQASFEPGTSRSRVLRSAFALSRHPGSTEVLGKGALIYPLEDDTMHFELPSISARR